MRTIEWTNRFKRDFRREKRGKYGSQLDRMLSEVLLALQSDKPLAERNRDHALIGVWAGYRDCHVRPDLILIYEKPDDQTLRLVRLGSHSELGL